jgi:hypothetical protein
MHIRDVEIDVTTYGGTLFVFNTIDSKSKSWNGYGLLTPASVSFMEYFLGGHFRSSAGWIGPYYFN